MHAATDNNTPAVSAAAPAVKDYNGPELPEFLLMLGHTCRKGSSAKRNAIRAWHGIPFVLRADGSSDPL